MPDYGFGQFGPMDHSLWARPEEEFSLLNKFGSTQPTAQKQMPDVGPMPGVASPIPSNPSSFALPAPQAAPLPGIMSDESALPRVNLTSLLSLFGIL